ncbi:IclR family transcriptional regulator [Shinella sp. NM-101]|uniref:IclR family transcriptional regulator n=1 Tax=Shinella sp. NM-101 TaxID=2744455 RepID=UPI001F45DBA3|nr:IclR family transcriptional regulator [Shinella sp. NM-101]
MDERSDNDGKVLPPQRSQTLVRGLEIMDAVAERSRTIAEIATLTGLTYPTVHRIVSVLVERRYLKMEKNAREFSLGPRLIELGFSAYSRIDLVRTARPLLEELGRRTGDTVHLAQREGNEVVYLEKLRGTRAVEISSRIGGRKPVISTGVGKAMLLDDTEEKLIELYRHDHRLIANDAGEAAWLSMMRNYREGEFSYDLGEDEPSIRCVAVPIRDATRRIIASVSVSSTVDYMDPARMKALIPEVKAVALAISAELGAPPERA